MQAVFAYGERLPVTSFFNLVYVMNPGAAFSFPAGADACQELPRLECGALAAGALAVKLVRNPMDRLTAFGFASVLGGALGNVIARARHGAVVDWLDLHLSDWHWRAFTITDLDGAGGAQEHLE